MKRSYRAMRQQSRGLRRNAEKRRVLRGRPYDDKITPNQLLFWFQKLSGITPKRVTTSNSGTIYAEINDHCTIRLANHVARWGDDITHGWDKPNLAGFSVFVKEVTTYIKLITP